MNFANLVQQAQQMQRKVNKVKKEFEEQEFDFESQDKIIVGKMNGKLEIKKLSIEESMLTNENKEVLEDLLTVTINKAIQNISQVKEDTLNQITNGVDVSAFL